MIKRYKISRRDQEEIKHNILKNAINTKVLQQALATFIISNDLSLQTIQSPSLHTLLKAANPALDQEAISSYQVISTHITALFLSYKDTVMKMLQSAILKIHLSINIWKSLNKLHFLGICAHFINYTSTLRRLLVGLPRVYNHTTREQLRVLLPYLKENRIFSTLGYIISDNHVINNKLCRLLSTYLLENEGIEWDALLYRLRCNGHILNLAAKAFFFRELKDDKDEDDELENDELLSEDESIREEILDALQKLHNIAQHIRDNDGRYQEFVDITGRLIPLNNLTQWNSWYHMLVVALQLQSAINTY